MLHEIFLLAFSNPIVFANESKNPLHPEYIEVETTGFSAKTDDIKIILPKLFSLIAGKHELTMLIVPFILTSICLLIISVSFGVNLCANL